MRKKEQIDSVNVILEECITAYPLSSFVISLYKQYQVRGSLSKKQLQGLYGKASKITGLAPGKLAGLEAIIKKMPTRYKSALPATRPLYEKDAEAEKLISVILAANPNHKRVLFLKAKFDNNEKLAPAEITELKRFESSLAKRKP